MANENLNIAVNVSGDEKAKAKLRAFDRMLEQTRKRAAALNPMRVNIIAKLDDRITGPARRIQNLLGSMAKKPVVVAVSTKAVAGAQTALRSLTKGATSKQSVVLSVVDKATTAIRGVLGTVKGKVFTLGLKVSSGAFTLFKEAVKLAMEWEQQTAKMGKVSFGETVAGQLAVIKREYDNLLASFGKGFLEAVKPRLAKIVDWLGQNKEKVAEWQDTLMRLSKEAFDGLLSWGEDCLKSLLNIFKDPGFQKLSWGDKGIYLLEKMLDAMNAWIAGPGGKKVQEIFIKLAEIATRAWLTAIVGMMKGSVKSLFEGNFLGAAGLAAGAFALGGGTLLQGAAKAVKGIGSLGKWAGSKIGIGRGTAGVTGTVAGSAGSVATVTRGITFGDLKAGYQLMRETGTGRVKSLVQGFELATNGVKLADSMAAKLAPLFGVAKKFIMPVGIALDAARIVTAPEAERGKVIGETAGNWAGAWAGAKLGATVGAGLGTIVPGLGNALGGLLGGAVGGVAGYFLGGKLGASVGEKLSASSNSYSALDNGNRQPEVTGFGTTEFTAPLAAAGAVGGTVINLNFAGMIQSMTVNSTDTQNVVQEVVEVVASSLQSIFENQGRC